MRTIPAATRLPEDLYAFVSHEGHPSVVIRQIVARHYGYTLPPPRKRGRPKKTTPDERKRQFREAQRRRRAKTGYKRTHEM